MVKSMTAYAEKTVEHDGLSASVEIRTYNSRFLDLVLRLPANCRQFESSIKQWITENIDRGRVECALTVKDGRGEAVPRFAVDTARAAGYHAALVSLQEALGIPGPVPLEMVARFEGVITSAEPEKPGETELAVIQEAVLSALADINIMREKEGSFLAADLAQRIQAIETAVDTVEKASDGLVDACARQLEERMASLLNGTVEIDESRILQEAALHADRCDISEEIVRTKSHIAQFRAAMADAEPCGRKLNFLLQEFNREVNTMGSKTANTGVSATVVAMKAELEKLREQVQNVE